jgi:hypothetical protein
MSNGKKISAVAVENASDAVKKGNIINYATVGPHESNAVNIPRSANDWSYYRSAICPILHKKGDRHNSPGTAVFVAPGLAVTARHNIIDEMESSKSDIYMEDVAISCAGVLNDNVIIWNARKISFGDCDIALISMEPRSEIGDGTTLFKFGVTTRCPQIGEQVHIVGFQSTMDSNWADISVDTGLYISKGKIKNVYPQGRDRLLLPWPSIEIDCGSLGGMSGGACFDKRGLLFGLICRGLDTEDKRGPTFVSWIIPALTFQITLPWPGRVYPNSTTMLFMDDRLIYIDRRDAIQLDDFGEFLYSPWS